MVLSVLEFYCTGVGPISVPTWKKPDITLFTYRETETRLHFQQQVLLEYDAYWYSLNLLRPKQVVSMDLSHEGLNAKGERNVWVAIPVFDKRVFTQDLRYWQSTI